MEQVFLVCFFRRSVLSVTRTPKGAMLFGVFFCYIKPSKKAWHLWVSWYILFGVFVYWKKSSLDNVVLLFFKCFKEKIPGYLVAFLLLFASWILLLVVCCCFWVMLLVLANLQEGQIVQSTQNR